ncbi:MAG: YceI family protein [Proteobacteria bacterium]|nr:YceI family protein [Pseudomonadota bacterium]
MESEMKYYKFLQLSVLLFSGLLLSTAVTANEWQLNPDASQLSFISTKKIHIAETHQFNQLSGFLDAQGQFSLDIDLASVDTHIAVRDERMKTYLFDIKQFSIAKVSAKIDLAVLDSIAEGASKRMSIDATLALHGEIQPLTLNVIVTRLVGAKLSVVSVQPVILNVGDFALVAGIEKLRELANLPSISHAVPVSFYLIFNHI